MNEAEAITFMVDEKNNIFQIDFQAIASERKSLIVCSRQQQVLFEIGFFFLSLSEIQMGLKW